MELQVPMIRRILDDNPETRYDIWNLALNDEDNEYLQTLSGDRITVINDYYGPSPWESFNNVYNHYAATEFSDQIFVKIDDDVVFVETQEFSTFIAAIVSNPDSVISAQVINNGACTPFIPDLWEEFERLCIPLENVHKSADYAKISHGRALDNWPELLGQPKCLVPTDDWLSINLIGYTWNVAVDIANKLVMSRTAPRQNPKRQPGQPNWDNPALDPTKRKHIGIDPMGEQNSLLVVGDEGLVNTMPRLILCGFLAAHLYFGPQRKQLNEVTWNEIRDRYAEVGKSYLEAL